MLHLDCFSGIAGNMFLAALLDLGLPREELEADLAGLRLPHRLIVRRVRRGVLAARHLEVRVPGAEPRRGRAARQATARVSRAHGAAAAHDHAHGDGHLAHLARHAGGAARAHGRPYREIVGVLEGARLSPEVRARALATFEALAGAEARVHGIPVERVHFHEVGAVDAIVDVTGVAIGLSRLGVARITASPVALGSGSLETAHGRLPLPAPATLELLRGIPCVPAHVEWETVTPTGAALLRSLVDEYRALPAMTIEGIGHGAGEDRPGPMPNVLRAVLGREAGAGSDRVVCMETNLDDLVPEHFDHLMERLFEEGALDVSIAHVQMKKNRPGFLVRVLARPADRMRVARTLFAESTAIGVRVSESDRIVLRRELREVETPWGPIGVKIVWDEEGAPHASAEYEDCKRAARKHGVPLRELVRAAEQRAREALRADGEVAP